MSNDSSTLNQITPDDGFFFGIGVFETIALEQGVPIFFREHLARMMASLERLGITAEPRELVDLARNACQGNAVAGSKVLKLVVTEKNRFATVRANAYSDARRAAGFSCAFSEVRRNETSPLVAMKTLNYGDCILQKRAAAARGIDEPLFLNTKDQVAEGATSNIFAVIQGEVVTPPVSCGLLPGVMRDFALRVTGAKERPLLPEELMQADEVFLTNSLMGAMPVRSIDGQSIACGNDCADEHREVQRTARQATQRETPQVAHEVAQRAAQQEAQRAMQCVAQQVNKAYREEVRAMCARWKQEEDPWGQLFGR